VTIPSRARRVGRWAARLAGVLLALFLAIHLPPVQRAVGWALARAAAHALGGRTSIERLEYRLWRGDVRVTGVRIETPAFQVRAAALRLHVLTRRTVAVELDDPVVVVPVPRTVPKETASLPSTRPAISIPAALGHLQVRGGRVELAGPGVVVRALDADVVGRGGDVWDVDTRASLDLRDAADVARAHFSGTAFPRTMAARVALQADGMGAHIEADVAFAADTGLKASYDLAVASIVDTAQALRQFGVARLPPEVGGRLAASGEVRFQGDPLATAVGTLRLRETQLLWRGRPLPVEGTLSLVSKGLRVDELALRSDDGLVQLSGTVPVLGRSHDWDVEGRVERMALAPFTSAPELMQAQLDGTFCLTGPEPDGQARAQLTWSDRSAVVTARKVGDTIVVDDLHADGAITLRADGVYNLSSRKLAAHVDAPSLDLARIPQIQSANAVGVLSVRARVEGVGAELAGTVDLETHGVSLSGHVLADTRLRVAGDHRRVVLSYDRGEGVVSFAEVHNAARRLHVSLDVSRLPWPALPPRDGAPPLTVNAKGTVDLDLPLDVPRELTYRAHGVSVSVQSGEVGLEADLSAVGDLQTVHLEGLELRSGSDRLEAHGRVALAAMHALDLDVRGALPLALVRLASPGTTLDGRLTAALHIGGTRSSPLVNGAADADIRLDEGTLRAHGVATPAEGAQLSLECERLRLSGAAEDPKAPRLTAKATARLLSAIGAPPEVQGSVDALTLDVEERHVTLVEPASFEWARGRLRLPSARIETQGHELRVQGEVAFEPRLSYSAQAEGTVDLAFLEQILPRSYEVGGEVDVSATVRGPENPSYEATAVIRGARFIGSDIGISVSSLEGRASLHDGVLRVERLDGLNGEGRVHVEGHFDVDERFRAKAVDLQAVARHLPYAWPKGLSAVVDAQLTFRGEGGDYRFAGPIDIVSGSYSRESDYGTESTDALDDLRAAAQARRSLEARIALDFAVRTLSDVRVRAPRAELAASGQAIVGGTLDEPAVTGTVNVAPAGRLEMGYSSLMLSEGRVTLEGFPDTPAYLDFRGRARVSGVLMEIAVRGRTDELQTELTAPDRPDMTQGDLASLLVTGNSAGGATDASGKIVADQLLGAVGGRLQKRAGDALIVDISTDTSFFSQDTEPTPRFNVGRRISGSLSLIYSAALDKTGSRWIVQFEPNQRIRLREIAEDDGSFATEVSDRVSWTFTRRASRTAAKAAAALVIGEVRLEGALPVHESTVRAWLGDLKPGKRYDAWAAHRAGDNVARKLAEQGWRAANVDVVPEPPAAGRRDVRVVVAPGPRLGILWSGDRVRRSWRRDSEKRWNPRVPLETAAAQLASQLELRLRARHYLSAEVKASWAGDETVKTVTFLVRHGPRGGDVVLDLTGNEKVSTDSLRKALPDLDSREMLEAYEQGGKGLRAVLRLAYAEKGFPFATVEEPTMRLDPETGDLHVKVTVTEGPHTVLREVTLPEAPAAETEPPEMELRVGEELRFSTYVKDRDALAAWYRREGYPEARVSARLVPVPDGVALRFEVQRGPRPHVRAVRVVGADRTRYGVIGRNVALGPGDGVSPLELARTRERLGRARAIASADVRTEPIAGNPEAKDVVVEVAERPDVEFAYGLRWQTNNPGDQSDELQGAASVSFNNLLRIGERTTAFAYLAPSHLYYGASIDLPPQGRLDTQLSLYLDDDKETDIDGVERLVRAAVFQQNFRAKTVLRGKRFCDLLRLQWGYSLKHYRFIDTLGALAPLPSPFVTDRGLLSLALMGDTRDAINDPHRGFLWSAATQLSAHALGSDESYVRLYGQFFFHHPVGPLVLATGLRAGVVPGSNPALLVEDRFRAGGPTTVRAFDQNDLGPRSHTNDPIGGQALLVFNQEVRFPLRGKLKGGVFYDAGNVFARATEMSLGDLRHDVGGGLRLIFPFGPLRLDWAYLLAAQPGESKSRFSFALGHVF
jgi:outer membrane protein insertion porin family